ncbi:MAG: right-handed parallel beta-helix repeat-containing protein [Candidatus Binatia bacterium]
MKDVKGFFGNPLQEATTKKLVTARQTLRRALPLALLLASLCVSPAMAAGPTGWGIGSCREVTAFPANLAEPGVYCLSYKHIDFPLASGALITISADNVVLDLNGATLDGTPKGSAYSYGIRAYGHSNITVRNGTIRGFNYGISLTAPLGYVNTRVRPSHSFLVENIRAIENRTAGIEVVGYDSEIRGNYIAHTGGSPDPRLSGHAWGMIAGGTGLRIIDNDVTHTHVNLAHSGGVTTGIFLSGALNAMLVNNRISEANFGIYGGVNWGKYRDNITINVGVPYTGGTNIGNNN